MVSEGKYQRVCNLLLSNAARPDNFWPWLQVLKGQRADVRSANKFFVACTVDWQQNAQNAWSNVKRWAEVTMGDPPDLLHRIAQFYADDWQAKKVEFGLHWLAAGHRRVREIASRVVVRYAGDSRRIWEAQAPAEILRRLEELGVGPQISRMIVGALIDTGQIDLSGKPDIKADTHTRRVLGRVFRGREVDEATATTLARSVSPDNPWAIDLPLYRLGQSHCRPTAPKCPECYLRPECAYAARSYR